MMPPHVAACPPHTGTGSRHWRLSTSDRGRARGGAETRGSSRGRCDNTWRRGHSARVRHEVGSTCPGWVIVRCGACRWWRGRATPPWTSWTGTACGPGPGRSRPPTVIPASRPSPSSRPQAPAQPRGRAAVAAAVEAT